jgi:hypothetical protein
MARCVPMEASRTLTEYRLLPGLLVVDGNVITGKGLDVLVAFGAGAEAVRSLVGARRRRHA